MAGRQVIGRARQANMQAGGLHAGRARTRGDEDEGATRLDHHQVRQAMSIRRSEDEDRLDAATQLDAQGSSDPCERCVLARQKLAGSMSSRNTSLAMQSLPSRRLIEKKSKRQVKTEKEREVGIHRLRATRQTRSARCVRTSIHG